MHATATAAERMSSPLLTLDDVAARLKCSRDSVRRMVKAGAIPSPIRLGCRLRWKAEEIEQWIAQGCPARPSPPRRPGPPR